MPAGRTRIGPAGIQFKETRDLPIEPVIALYQSVGWSSAEKPVALHNALRNSHSLVTAWQREKLVGLGNALSDGHLAVYYSHLLVHPEFQGQGIGAELLRRLMVRYEGFHQQVLVADARSIEFFRKAGFERAGRTEPMWIYAGHDH